jgi:hypothetical protein
MKKTLPFIFMALAISFLLISGIMSNSGSPGAKTGSPIDGSTCAQCHNSTVTTAEWITTTIPETGYVPGEKYTITLSASDAAAVKIGFELTAETTLGKQGTFIITDDAKTKLTNGNKSVTHKSTGVNPVSGANSWSVDWTAPIAGTGEVTFYAAINAANGNGNTSGDKIYTSELAVSEATTTSVAGVKRNRITLYPNPAYGFFMVEAGSEIQQITIIDLAGKLVHSEKNIRSTKTQVNLDNLKPGLYIAKMVTGDGEFTQKLQLN